MSYPKRGEVFLVNLDPTIGAEIQKTRPAVVIQNNILNQYSPLVIVCPITSTIRSGETRVFVKAPGGGLDNDSMILTQQVRCLDKKRLVKKLGKLKIETMREVDLALKITQGLIPL
jgi:mRNA interferase MazF